MISFSSPSFDSKKPTQIETSAIRHIIPQIIPDIFVKYFIAVFYF